MCASESCSCDTDEEDEYFDSITSPYKLRRENLDILRIYIDAIFYRSELVYNETFVKEFVQYCRTMRFNQFDDLAEPVKRVIGSVESLHSANPTLHIVKGSSTIKTDRNKLTKDDIEKALDGLSCKMQRLDVLIKES